LVHDVITVHAHALGAINISPLGVTDTTSGLLSIPVLVSITEAVSLLLEEGPGIELLGGTSEWKVLNVLATSVTRAVVGTSSTGTSLTFISREALTFTRITITDATVGALSVLVVVSKFIRCINPSELERADTLRAITRVKTHTHTPVIITGTDTVLKTISVTGTIIIATASKSDGN
jgi:hypothetical protein